MKKGIIWGLAFILALCILSSTAMAEETWWQKFIRSTSEPIRCETPWGDIGSVSAHSTASVQRVNIGTTTTNLENIKIINMSFFSKIAFQFGFWGWRNIDNNGSSRDYGYKEVR